MAIFEMSSQVWTVPIENGFLIGKRSIILRKVKGGRELSVFLEDLKNNINTSAMEKEKIKEKLSHQYAPAFVEEALHHLLELGIIKQIENPTPSRREPHASGQESSTKHYITENFDESGQAYEKLKYSSVAVVGHGVLAEKVSLALGDMPLKSVVCISDSKDKIKRALEDKDFIIAVADDPVERLRLFPKVNALNLEGANKPWLTGYMDGHQAFIGPMFVPEETGCYRCLELREDNHLPYPEEFAIFKQALANNKISCDPNAPAPAFQVASGYIATEALKFLARIGHPATFQTLIVVDLNYLDTERHRLLKVPNCDVCGTHLTTPFRKTWDM